MTTSFWLYFFNAIFLSLATFTLIFFVTLVKYFLKRKWHKQKFKFVWTQISSVERRSNLSYEEFIREYAFAGKPVIITDLMKNWEASTKWTLDFFKSEYGSVKVEVMDVQLDDINRTSVTSMIMADYIDYMSASNRNQLLYLANFILDKYPELYKNYEVPVYFPDLLQKLPKELRGKYGLNLSWLFIGPKGASVGLHNDVLDTSAWLALISGRKRFVFFTPDQEDFLYDGKVNVFNPDLEKFPLYAKAKPVEVILEPGEVIYTPSKWWHQVENLEDSIAVTHNAIDQWNSELVFQAAINANPVKGYLLPFLLEFPWVSRTLYATALL
jgi:Cupin-like domain